MSPSTIPLSFGGNSLQTFDGNHGIFVQSIEHAGKSAKRAEMYALSHANASIIPFVEYPNKPIQVTGEIVGTTIADCDALIDQFNSYLLTQGGNLDIGYNGGTRRYIATATNIDVQRPNNLNYATFSVTFTCTQPFGQDTSSTTILSATSRTAANYNDTYTFLGTAPYQQPVITITLTAVSASGSQYLSFGNGATGQAITLSRSTWANGDVVVIDTTQKTVTVNGANAVFTGAFPEFAPGTGTLQYYDSFTSRTFNITVAYTVRYL